jgi:glyoxylase-like metal-dependent hydrolase (beta-lactamase superfamily II)
MFQRPEHGATLALVAIGGKGAFMSKTGLAKFGRARGAAHIRCVLAPNPSMMTGAGTNTYILGTGRVAIIDPGPAMPQHHAAIMAALSPGESISHIFVTHTHLDHSGLAVGLGQATGASVYGFGGARAGRSATMQRLAETMKIGGDEGVDLAFRPDVVLPDGDRVTHANWELEVVHTPGHIGNHICLAAGDVLFSGDHVMGWSTSLISPPDGDMTDYMASLHKLALRPWAQFLPGHGAPVTAPARRLAELIAHRRARGAAILAALDAGPMDIAAMTAQIYPSLQAALIPAAHRNVFAHLIDLEARNLITAMPDTRPDAIFIRV